MINAVLVNSSPTRARTALAAVLTAVLVQLNFIKDQIAAPDGTLENGDNLTRLVQVRDLLAGQNWFDLMQYRLGVAPGLEMHWSRLVDAPIALLIQLGDLFGNGEVVAYYAWPALMTLVAMAAILYGVRRISPDLPMLSVCVIGGFAMISGGAFQPGAFDHHNVQTALSLWMIALLLPGSGSVLNHAIAGLFAALMLAIGMETLPYVFAAGCYMAFLIARNQSDAENVQAFGLSLAVSTGLLFLALVGPDYYASASCDSFSTFQLVMSGSSGLTLAALGHACKVPRSPAFKVAALCGMGGIALILLLGLFPHCAGDPLASLDPRLKTLWLDGVLEAQSIVEITRRDPYMLPGLLGMPVIGLLVSLRALVTSPNSRPYALFALMLAVSIAVTAWQIRGSLFAIPFAAMPLALFVGRLSQLGARPLKLIAAWLVSVSMSWGLMGSAAAHLVSGAPSPVEMALASGGTCQNRLLLQAISGEPSGTLLGNTNLGPVALSSTPHRVIAGPYHRNAAGNLLLIEAMTGNPAQAKELMAGAGVTILAVCAEGPDEKDFAALAPQGFLSRLTNGEQFEWLELVETSQKQPLRFWRVKSSEIP